MAFVLALDVGKRHTGVAFGDDVRHFVMALDTIEHASDLELCESIVSLVEKRKVSTLIIGLPLLPDGVEGSQAKFTRALGTMIGAKAKVPVEFIDERYTTAGSDTRNIDPDAKSACTLLETFLDRLETIDN